mmetsp:Transcript_71477/g.204999  ORF Transcript_71477/g.204999 Transcript_71477/m.204999 type:complete len:281 (+) Transcript_71477:252-1094(+)
MVCRPWTSRLLAQQPKPARNWPFIRLTRGSLADRQPRRSTYGGFGASQGCTEAWCPRLSCTRRTRRFTWPPTLARATSSLQRALLSMAATSPSSAPVFPRRSLARWYACQRRCGSYVCSSASIRARGTRCRTSSATRGTSTATSCSSDVPQTLVHDCLFSAVSWLVFESCRQKVFANRGSSELAAHESLVLGATAGAVSALVTTPCDVLRTRIIGREPGDAAAAQGLRATALEMYRREGAAIFWRGCVLRIAHLAPSQGVYMLLYEVAKGRIAGWRETTT